MDPNAYLMDPDAAPQRRRRWWVQNPYLHTFPQERPRTKSSSPVRLLMNSGQPPWAPPALPARVVDADPAAGARVADFGGGGRHFGINHRSQSEVVRGPMSGGMLTRGLTAAVGGLRGTSGALEAVESA
ncbi:hypothetical protein NDU88_005448 [Pleurodeles waltl]|uniref:Uncharacterized protein n=1 Tax=Pleurodeles waltl TaxID=8319 RepID=A0AAV7TUU7_PLEWA|nr:hypothetical protein NDU88_005448 [Pleurodeles waltl]